MWVSLQLAVPLFILQVIASTAFALLLVFFRHTKIDFWGVVLCVLMLSISALFYIIVGQFFFSRTLHLVPISGYCRRPRRGEVPAHADRPVAARPARHRGAPLPRHVPRGDRQGLRPHRAGQGLAGIDRPVPPRAQERPDPDHHQRRLLPPVRVPRQPGVRELLRHPRPGRVRDRGHRRPGLRDRPFDGLRRRGALHRQLHRDRPRLHLGRPARPARPRHAPPAPMPQFVFLWTDVVLWAMLLLLVATSGGSVAAPTCAPPGTRCCAIRRR